MLHADVIVNDLVRVLKSDLTTGVCLGKFD